MRAILWVLQHFFYQNIYRIILSFIKKTSFIQNKLQIEFIEYIMFLSMDILFRFLNDCLSKFIYDDSQ